MSKPPSQIVQSRRGAGDHYYAERVAVPSSRKFTATPVKDPKLHLTLKKELDKLSSQGRKLQKAKSVAEITPTKTKVRRSKRDGEAPPATLHATPRPLDGTPSGRTGEELLAGRLIYHRLVLQSWRRNRARLATLNESSRRHQEQIGHLERQVDVLKNLRKSESEKCQAAINELAQVRNKLEKAEVDVKILDQDKEELMKDANETTQRLLVEIDNAKNDAGVKKRQIERLEQEVQRVTSELRKIEEERVSLALKAKKQYTAIKLDKETIKTLEEALETAKHNLRNVQDELKKEQKLKTSQTHDYNELLSQYQLMVASKDCITAELNGLYASKEELKREIAALQSEVDELKGNLQRVTSENCNLKDDLDRISNRKLEVWRNAKQLMEVIWVVMRHGAYLMLPAMPRYN